jgi:hypothetical protein
METKPESLGNQGQNAEQMSNKSKYLLHVRCCSNNLICISNLILTESLLSRCCYYYQTYLEDVLTKTLRGQNVP